MRAALGGVGLAPKRVRSITGGWAYWTYELDGALIARFPQRLAIARAAERELRLLPELARSVRFRVPEPMVSGRWDGAPFFVYRRIDGDGLTPEDVSPAVADQVGAVLRELHAFPPERAAALLQCGPAEGAWRRYVSSLWPDVESVLPVMPPRLADEVGREFHRFLDAMPSFTVCLVHNDLGLEHILYDATRAEVTGIIDFEDATLGDPLIDFVPLRYALGQQVFEQVTRGRDLGDRVAERMWFYRWMGSVHAIIYGVQQGVDEERDAGLRELPRRLRRRP